MKKKKIKIEKSNHKTFAFLPEVVLEHLNDPPAKESREISKPAVKAEKPSPKPAQTIIFDPLADPFDGTTIEIKPIGKKKLKKLTNSKINSNENNYDKPNYKRDVCAWNLCSIYGFGRSNC